MTYPPFIHENLPMRVVFGQGRIQELATEASRLNLHNVVVISTGHQADVADDVAQILGDVCHGTYPHAVMHVPEDVVAEAVSYINGHSIDGCIAVGGGSAIGLAKAVALQTELPTIALPTTYAGSEMTPIWGITSATEGKKTGRSSNVLPKCVVYDPDLTTTLPPAMSATSGLNAIAHAVEALYAPDGSPIIDTMAAESVRQLSQALPAITLDPNNIEARSEALLGAWMAGVCLASTSMSLHHKLCHILGGRFDLPHAETHAVVLPHVAQFNLAAAPRAAHRLESALGRSPVQAIVELAAAVDAPRSLRELGMPADGIELVVADASVSPYANPRPVGAAELRALVTAAYEGAPRLEPTVSS